MKEEKNETGAWLKVEDLYGDGNPKEGQLCLGKKGDGTIWLYRFSWWDDVTGAFYPMINPTERPGVGRRCNRNYDAWPDSSARRIRRQKEKNGNEWNSGKAVTSENVMLSRKRKTCII